MSSTPMTPGPTGVTGGTTPSQGSGDEAKEQAKQAAGTAADESKHVADVAKSEAKSVVEDSKEQARSLLDEAMSQVDEQSRTQRDRLVSMLRSFGDDVEKMAQGEQAPSGMAQDLARQLADRAHELSGRMDGREPTELLDEVRSFARRRPGTFLLGALAAGVVAGRLTRGAKKAQSDDAGGAGRSATPLYDDVRATTPAPPAGTSHGGPAAGVTGPAGTASGDPVAGVGTPTQPTAYPTGATPGEPGTTMDQRGLA